MVLQPEIMEMAGPQSKARWRQGGLMTESSRVLSASAAACYRLFTLRCGRCTCVWAVIGLDQPDLFCSKSATVVQRIDCVVYEGMMTGMAASLCEQI